jgi:hypothetical protein
MSMARRSNAPPGRVAESTPSVMPHNVASVIAASASWTVLGNRSARSRAMGRWVT